MLDEVYFLYRMSILYRCYSLLLPGVMPCFGAANAITAVVLCVLLIISSAGADIKHFHVHVGNLLSHRDPTLQVSQYLHLCLQFLAAL